MITGRATGLTVTTEVIEYALKSQEIGEIRIRKNIIETGCFVSLVDELYIG